MTAAETAGDAFAGDVVATIVAVAAGELEFTGAAPLHAATATTRIAIDMGPPARDATRNIAIPPRPTTSGAV
jgi:hypothetical protein